MTTTSSRRFGALALGAVLVLSACSSSGASSAPSTAASTAPTTAPGSTAPESQAPAGVTGSIIVSGSSTVEPISSAIAEAFKAANPDFNYTVTGPGTGDGFKTFCAGETDISDASRKIKDEEAATCDAAGIEFVELPIAYRRHHDHDLAGHRGRLPLVRRPVRADRPRVDRLRQVDRRLGDRQGAGIEHCLPGRRPRDHRPGRGVGHLRQLSRAGARRDRDRPQDDRRDRQAHADAAGLRREPQRQHDHRRHRRLPDRSAGSASPSPRRTPGPSRSWASPRSPTGRASARPPRRSPMAPIRSPGPCTSTSTRPRPPRTPRSRAYVDYYLADGTISTALETVPYVNLPADKLAATRGCVGRSRVGPPPRTGRTSSEVRPVPPFLRVTDMTRRRRSDPGTDPLPPAEPPRGAATRARSALS